MATRDYLYYDFTVSLCSKCLRRVDAKILIKDEKVYLHKLCHEHGQERVLVSTEAEYYKKARNFMKPGDIPRRCNTPTRWGCPYDCGLCPDHEQHSCVSLVEITERCNLSCPTCYAVSSPTTGRHRTLAEVERMLDAVVANEGEPDVVQISGGEPTIHPEFFEILAAAKRRPIRHLMLNTNGIRLANEKGFAERLAEFRPGFEIYLQFDSLSEAPLRTLRGIDSRDVHRRALESLNRLNLSTTLVVTLQKGLNVDEIGSILEFALEQPCVRGVTFQPTQVAGRLENFNPETDRLTLSEVRREILRQCSIFTEADLIPVPCHPEGIFMGYALKAGGKTFPLSDFFEPEELLLAGGNTINPEKDPKLKEKVIGLFSTGNSPEAYDEKLQSILCCLPKLESFPLKYDNVFRVIGIQFFDAYNFDLRPIKKTCVHIVSEDLKLVPFDTMNLLYRDPARLEELRAGGGVAGPPTLLKNVSESVSGLGGSGAGGNT